MRREIVSHPATGDRHDLFGTIAEDYYEEMVSYHAAECDHSQSAIFRRRISDGRFQIKEYCRTCGKSIGKFLNQKNGTEFPDYPENLKDDYHNRRQAERAAIILKYIEAQAQQDKNLSAKANDWQDEYAAYRRTEKWQRMRSKVLRRANGICEGCGENDATLIHHKDYSHLRDELLFQLVALCTECHAKSHPEHDQRGFYDNDYFGCADCRWFEEPATCGRYDEKCYTALSPDGDCGPKFVGFEGLK